MVDLLVLAIAGSVGYLAPETRQFIKKQKKEHDMFGKIKKVFFNGIFAFLYISFIAQVVSVLGWAGSIDNIMRGLGMLSLEWLGLIAARYLSKRSSGAAQHNGFNNRRR